MSLLALLPSAARRRDEAGHDEDQRHQRHAACRSASSIAGVVRRPYSTRAAEQTRMRRIRLRRGLLGLGFY